MTIDSINSANSSGIQNNNIVIQSEQTVRPAVLQESPIQVTSAGDVKNQANQTNQKEQQDESQPVSSKSVEDAVKRANNKMSKTHCEFSYNDKINRVSITVYDDETGEVVREIPPEESLKMLEKLWELTGLMLDEKR